MKKSVIPNVVMCCFMDILTLQVKDVKDIHVNLLSLIIYICSLGLCKDLNEEVADLFF